MKKTAPGKNFALWALATIAVILLAVIFYSPVWWVSLKAPQYPPDAFPSGIRIQFHVNGVFNGCKKIDSKEKFEEEALNCKHEMDAINHYVGMYPIAAGAPVERAVSPFVFVYLAILIFAFALNNKKGQIGLLLLAAGLISIWAYLVLFTPGGALKQSAPYKKDLTSTLQLDEQEIASWSGHTAIQKSYSEALGRYFPTTRIDCDSMTPLLKYLDVYASQNKPFDEMNDILSNRGVDTSRLMDMFSKQYDEFSKKPNLTPANAKADFLTRCEALNKNTGTTDATRLQIISNATWVFYIVFVVAMFGLPLALMKFEKLKWLLILVPMMLPLFFIIDYAAWLWWFGHNLSSLGAFTVKPFMPTVFGLGKVAQFSTHSYPDYGFGLIVLVTICTGAMALIRHKKG